MTFDPRSRVIHASHHFIPSSPPRRPSFARRASSRVAFAFDSRRVSPRRPRRASHGVSRVGASAPRPRRARRRRRVALRRRARGESDANRVRVRRRRRANRRIHHPRGAFVVHAVGAVDDRVRPGRANDQRADAHDVAGDADDDRDAGRGRDAVRRAVRVRERARRASRREIERAWR